VATGRLIEDAIGRFLISRCIRNIVAVKSSSGEMGDARVKPSVIRYSLDGV